jgi:hypothetical protein
VLLGVGGEKGDTPPPPRCTSQTVLHADGICCKVHTMGGSPWAVVRGTIAHGARVEVTKMTSKKQPIS